VVREGFSGVSGIQGSGMSGMGTHQGATMAKDEWLTPPEIIAALGEFDLDPCAPIVRPWDTANYHFTKENGFDGLAQKWFGRVWCNPPYGLEAAKWLEMLAEHRNGIALIFARTETKMFFEQVWDKAFGVLFIEGRLYFHHVDGSRAKANAGAPSVLVAYSAEDANALSTSGIRGKMIWLDK